MTGSLDEFSARASALGLLYQYRHALLVLLREARLNPDAGVTIERLDDVALTTAGETKEATQTKYHEGSGGRLTDMSTDLWKTLRIWCTGILDGTFTVPGNTFVLVTTGEAPEGSAARLLRSSSRDPDTALRQLEQARASSASKTNADAYETFDRLTQAQKQALLDHAYVLDEAPGFEELDRQIEELIAYATDRRYRGPFVQRLTSWWLYRVEQHLRGPEDDIIGAAEVEAEISDLRERFLRTNLPIDAEYVEMESPIAADDSDDIFVEQLRLIAVGNDRIDLAIRDYYRAFEQRSRWVRDDLLHLSDLTKYERRLVEEWERHFRIMRSRMKQPCDDDTLCASGEELYSRFEADVNIHIRRDCTEPFVCRGSYQILANDCKVGWHPEFVERLRSLLGRAGAA